MQKQSIIFSTKEADKRKGKRKRKKKKRLVNISSMGVVLRRGRDAV